MAPGGEKRGRDTGLVSSPPRGGEDVRPVYTAFSPYCHLQVQAVIWRASAVGGRATAPLGLRLVPIRNVVVVVDVISGLTP